MAGRSTQTSEVVPRRAPPPLVTLLLDEAEPSIVAVQRACSAADVLDAHLRLVLAVARTASAAQAEHARFRAVAAVHQVSPGRPFEATVVHGSLVSVGVEVQRRAASTLVVIGALHGARDACALADELGVPVLIARDARPQGRMIVASDLQHAGYPVISVARQLATRMRRHVTFFHNASAAPQITYDPLAGPDATRSAERIEAEQLAAKAAYLHQVTGMSDGRADVIVGRSLTAADAILRLAREHDADLVVVGHASRPWWRRLLRAGVTEKVLARTRRSVLVVPTGRRAA